MEFIQGFDRNQLQMISFDQFVVQDSWARIVGLFVDILPLKEANNSTSIWHFKAAMGIYLYTNER